MIDTAADASISIENVSKSFGSTHAVRNLDLQVPRGSLCGFLGPNGAGKSTTIRMIMSIIYPDSGSVRVLDGSALQAKDRIGYLPEERGIYRKMRVGEFLHYIGRLKGLGGSDLTKRVHNWLERIELPHVVNKRCHELSKGMQQKVQFLASLIHDPELLILDEPFSGLDPVNAAMMVDIVRDLHRQGRTIIFSTHVLHQAEQMCERIFLINHGVKLLDATLDEIRSQFDPRTILARPMNGESNFDAIAGVRQVRQTGERTYEIYFDNDADPTTVMQHLLAAAPMRSIELRQLSLDEVFVQLVMKDEGEVAAQQVREQLSMA